jgi:polar amino acid transport system substrate-binding protein
MEYVPWARAEKGVKEARYDILPNTWKNEKRLEYLDYSEPYASNEVAFIKRKDDPFEYNGLESLKGKKIGIVRGYGYNTDFLSSSDFHREESNDLFTCIKKLLKNRIDLSLEDRIVARVIIAKEDPNALSEIAFTNNVLSSNDLFVTVGKKNPRHKEIIEAFNKGLAAIKANGTYNSIMKNYGIE